MPQASNATSVWVDPETPALCLIALGVDRWGVDCLNWLPGTWRDEVRDEFAAPLALRNLDRIGAAQALLTSPDEYYQTASGFNDIVQGIAAEWFDSDVWHPPTAAECAWGVLEAYLIDPPGSDDRFSPEVNRYVEMICRQDGFAELPPVFRSFGFRPDASLPSSETYDSDPALAAAAEAGQQDASESLRTFLGDKLYDLAARLSVIPFSRFDPLPVVRQLRTRAVELGPRTEPFD